MNMKNSRSRRDAVAIHDGLAWRLVVDGEEILPSASDGRPPSGGWPSPAKRLPGELVDAAVANGCRSVSFLVSGDVHRIDGAIPSGASLERANAEMLAAIAEETGSDMEGSLVAGFTASWPGVRKPFTLAGLFDGDASADFRDALAEAGVRFGGIASLELAMLAAWRSRLDGMSADCAFWNACEHSRPSRDASLVVVGYGNAFVVPAPRGLNTGPRSVPCGMRHFTADPASWSMRFQRSAAIAVTDAPLHVVVVGGEAYLPPVGDADQDVVAALRRTGFANVVGENAETWMRAAAHAALAPRPNRLRGVSVPVANPWEPRRRFSNGWLVAAAVFVLAMPCLFRALCEKQCERECAALAAEQGKWRPLEERIKRSQKALADARARLAKEEATQRALLGMRRPLVAFVDVAYFFCKHSGDSLVLESIVQKGERIEASGTFSDPEDGVRLNSGILEYAKEKNIDIVKNETTHGDEAENTFETRFIISLDCSGVGGAKR